MNILYLSCHAILEANEVKLFHELGYNIFSPGAYINPKTGGGGMRPPMPELEYSQEIIDIWQRHEEVFPERDGKTYITKEIANKFDVIIIMHMPSYIENNWQNIKHKRVILRTIGQNVASTEHNLRKYKNEGLQIVRYSPMEANIPNFAGQDAFIRFYVDDNEFKDWNGNEECIVTFNQAMKDRDVACNYAFYEEVTRPFSRKLFGPGNENVPFSYGKIEFSQLKQEMRNNRCYFYTGTHPASYTLNFMEALCTGIPMVCVGQEHGNAKYFANHDLYEIPRLIEHGVNGFYSDNKEELCQIINILMDDPGFAKKVSENGRKTAIHHFNKDMIKHAWKAYLEQ